MMELAAPYAEKWRAAAKLQTKMSENMATVEGAMELMRAIVRGGGSETGSETTDEDGGEDRLRPSTGDTMVTSGDESEAADAQSDVPASLPLNLPLNLPLARLAERFTTDSFKTTRSKLSSEEASESEEEEEEEASSCATERMSEASEAHVAMLSSAELSGSLTLRSSYAANSLIVLGAEAEEEEVESDTPEGPGSTPADFTVKTLGRSGTTRPGSQEKLVRTGGGYASWSSFHDESKELSGKLTVVDLTFGGRPATST